MLSIGGKSSPSFALSPPQPTANKAVIDNNDTAFPKFVLFNPISTFVFNDVILNILYFRPKECPKIILYLINQTIHRCFFPFFVTARNSGEDEAAIAIT